MVAAERPDPEALAQRRRGSAVPFPQGMRTAMRLWNGVGMGFAIMGVVLHLAAAIEYGNFVEPCCGSGMMAAFAGSLLGLRYQARYGTLDADSSWQISFGFAVISLGIPASLFLAMLASPLRLPWWSIVGLGAILAASVALLAAGGLALTSRRDYRAWQQSIGKGRGSATRSQVELDYDDEGPKPREWPRDEAAP